MVSALTVGLWGTEPPQYTTPGQSPTCCEVDGSGGAWSLRIDTAPAPGPNADYFFCVVKFKEQTEHPQGWRCSSDTALLRQAPCHRARAGFRGPLVPPQRTASSQPSSPSAQPGTWGRAGRMPALPRCRVIGVLPALCSPTMSPFMRAEMKCEALGINSTTGPRPRASERCSDGRRSRGGGRRCSSGVLPVVHL